MLNIQSYKGFSFIVAVFVFTIIPTICYTSTETTKEESFNCAISREAAQWSNRHPGKPGRRYAIKTLGMRIKAEEKEGEKKIVLYWDDDDDENDCANPISRFSIYNRAVPVVWARCMVGDEQSTKKVMYSVHQGRPAPKLDCLEEESLQVKVFRPNNPDPEAFVFYADVTTIDDDEEEPPSSSSSSQPMNSTTTTTTATPTNRMMENMRLAAPPMPIPSFMPPPILGASK